MDTRRTSVVTFQRANIPHSADDLEEVDFVKPPQRSVDKLPHTSKKKCSNMNHLLIITVSWGILLLVMVPRIYLTSVLSANNAELMSKNQQMEEEEAQLNKRMKKTFSVFVSRHRSLTSKSHELQVNKSRLEKKIAELEEFNVNRTQSIIDAYCPLTEKGEGRRCDVCEEGWQRIDSNCFMLHGAELGERRSWEDAEKACRAKGSHLPINEDSMKWFPVIYDLSDFFWIGLKVVNGEWKWLDGTNVSQSSWKVSPQNGLCASSAPSFTFGAPQVAKCSDRKPWICEKKALIF